MTYIFNDPIHGTIELNKVLVGIIDTPEFQRLRNIKQTGAVSYVYPGATHTRFEHCVGVCHLAGKVIDKLSEQTLITEVDKLCVQIAGLLHDVGHGPFSHLFDDCFIQEIITADWSHELQSCRIFDHLLANYGHIKNSLYEAGIRDVDKIFVKELINTKDYQSKDDNKWLFKGRPKEKSFLYEIVSNERTGIDVDKFDYLLRDCYYLGVNCTLDWRRLVQRMKIVHKDGQYRIAIRDKEKDNVYNMFYLRMHLRRIAYQHPTCSSIELMISDILKLCNDVVFPNILLSDTIHDMEKYLSLTDSVIERISNMTHCSTNTSHLDEAKELIRRIQTRRLYTLVAETPPSTEEFKDKRKVVEEVVADNDILAEHIHVATLSLNFGKWSNTGDPVEPVLFFDKNGTVLPEKFYEEFSLFVPKSWCQKQLRFFCTSEDQNIIDLAKKSCTEWISRQFA
ncbi:hypothetical protein ACHWQZ_G016515 [Mnemiopsis leidyi]